VKEASKKTVQALNVSFQVKSWDFYWLGERILKNVRNKQIWTKARITMKITDIITEVSHLKKVPKTLGFI